MTIECELHFTYSDKEMAIKIQHSLYVDNQDFITSEISGNSIIAHIEAKSCMSLLHTLEDFLSCLSTAENLLEG